MIKSGFEPDQYLRNQMLLMHVKCKMMIDARYMFDEMPERNLVLWNRIIGGLVDSGDYVETIPIEARAEKAMEAIHVCCFGRDPIEEVDEKLLCIMLAVVFPSVGKSEINRIVSDKAKRVAEGVEDKYPEPKPLSKEAVQLQMKDLQFLRQNSET